MSARLTETFEQRLARAKEAALATGRPLSMTGWVFTAKNGAALDGDNVRKRIFQPALTKAKLRQIRIHDLRHTVRVLADPERGEPCVRA